MSRGPKWTKSENDFLTGMLLTHGDKPREWTEEVMAVIKARLHERSQSGIYQQALKLLKSRKMTIEEKPQYMFTTGA